MASHSKSACCTVYPPPQTLRGIITYNNWWDITPPTLMWCISSHLWTDPNDWDCKRHRRPRGWKNPNFFSEKPKLLAQCDNIKVKITCKTKRSKERRHQNPGSPNDDQLHQQLSDPEHLHYFFNHSLICGHGSLLQHFLWLFMSLLPEKLEGRQRRRCEDQRRRGGRADQREEQQRGKGQCPPVRETQGRWRRRRNWKKGHWLTFWFTFCSQVWRIALTKFLVNGCLSINLSIQWKLSLSEETPDQTGSLWKLREGGEGWVGIVTLTDQPARQGDEQVLLWVRHSGVAVRTHPNKAGPMVGIVYERDKMISFLLFWCKSI